MGEAVVVGLGEGHGLIAARYRAECQRH
jgi:hypothetical protein